MADAINKVRSSKLDLFSEAMDSYVNSVLELFNFVGAEEEGRNSADFSRRRQHGRESERAGGARRHQRAVQAPLGSGTYSVVKQATDRRTGEEVAVKVITKSQLSGDDTVSLIVSFSVKMIS